MTPPTATTPAQLLDLALDVIALQFRLAAQARTLSGDEDAGGTFGVLRSLDAYGPTTVPDLARLRPVSRQRIQKLVDLLRARGFVETRPNPRHRRSPLIALTDAGRAHLAAARARYLAATAVLAPEFSADEIAAARATLAKLHAALGPGAAPEGRRPAAGP